MAKTKNIATEIENLIKSNITVYSDEAPDEAEYPYAVIELARTKDDIVSTYELEVNVWDEYKTYSRADSKMDDIEEILDKTVVGNGHYTIVIHKGDSRDHVTDESKEIKRVRALFILQYAEGRS